MRIWPYAIFTVLSLLLVFTANGCAKGEEEVPSSSSSVVDDDIVQTIQDETGDVYDCYRFTRQPTFKDPSFRGPIIKTEPAFIRQLRESSERSSSSFSHTPLPELQCREGTVPIRRAIKVEHSEHKPLWLNPQNYSTIAAPTTLNYYYAARGTTNGTYYGGRASLNIYGAVKPIGPLQNTGGSLWISDAKSASDQDVIAVGWMVSPELYNDQEPRLTVFHWVTGKGGCFNMLCSGFVHFNPKFALGMKLQKSTFLEEQVYLTVTVAKDPKTHHWWLFIDDDYKTVGYWPNGFFPSMRTSCAQVVTGGDTSSPMNVESPPMGTGRHRGFDVGNDGARNILTIDKDYKVVRTWLPLVYLDHPYCYHVYDLKDYGGDRGLSFGFGGVGRCYS